MQLKKSAVASFLSFAPKWLDRTEQFSGSHAGKVSCRALTAVSVSVAVSTVTVESGGSSDLHLQLFALGGVCRHGVTVVGSEAALALCFHRLSQLIGCVRAGAPTAQAGVLPVGKTRKSIKRARRHSNR